MNTNSALHDLKREMETDPAEIAGSLTEFIRDHMNTLERDGVILGLSGGIDSAVVAALCTRAVGPDKVLALIMPDKDSDRRHVKDALELGLRLNLETRLIEIDPYLEEFGSLGLFPLNRIPLPRKVKTTLTKKAYEFYQGKTGESPFSASLMGFRDKPFRPYLSAGNAYYRIKHRVRMVLLYLYAELENRLVVGAANRTEYRIGFFVKHGCDDDADIMPILGLYKSQVRELAKYLSVPDGIIEKPPSPDIIPGLSDEEAIGIPYSRLDLILLALDHGMSAAEISRVLDVTEKAALKVKQMTERSEHMRTVYVPGEFRL